MAGGSLRAPGFADASAAAPHEARTGRDPRSFDAPSTTADHVPLAGRERDAAAGANPIALPFVGLTIVVGLLSLALRAGG